jgi:hypothetical protein
MIRLISRPFYLILLIREIQELCLILINWLISFNAIIILIRNLDIPLIKIFPENGMSYIFYAIII